MVLHEISTSTTAAFTGFVQVSQDGASLTTQFLFFGTLSFFSTPKSFYSPCRIFCTTPFFRALFPFSCLAMLRICSPRIRHSQLRSACRRFPFPLTRIQQASSVVAKKPIITDTASLKEFMDFEKTLQRIKPSNTSLDTKIKFLLSNPTKIDISDLNISGEDSAIFFGKLVSKYQIDFNTVEILGLGKLLKILPNVSVSGLHMVKNCGILGPSDEISKSVTEVFTHKYDEKLQLLTIDILITNKCYNEAYRFLRMYDALHHNHRKTAKFRFKLSKFSDFSKAEGFSISARDIVDNNLVHLYVRELLKSKSLPLNQKLEKFLLILYKWLNLIKVSKLNKPSENQIHVLDTNFLSILSRQEGISYSVYLAYFVKLYPKSIPLLQELSLLAVAPLSAPSSSSRAYAPMLSDLPQVNIRNELIQSSQPYMEDLSMLYSKFFHEMFPNRSHTKALFKKYHSLVLRFQKNEASKLSSQSNYFRHPFSRFNHDSSVLSAFIHHSFENPTGILRPLLTFNIVEKFYSDLKIANVDFYKSSNHKSHKRQLSSLVQLSLETSSPTCNITAALKLLQLLTHKNILLNIEVYLKAIDSLIKLDYLVDARKIFMFVVEHPILSTSLTKEHIAAWCYRYSWPYPEHMLVLPSPAENQYFTYNEDYLSGDLSPLALIGYLDSLIEAKPSLKEDGNA